MPISRTESALEGVTITIAYLEKEENCNPIVLEELKEYRRSILHRLQLDLK
jgi:hypothetical protein